MSGPQPPDFVGARDHVIASVVRFVHRLRQEGVTIPANAAITAVQAMSTIGFDDRERVATALRASLLSDPRDIEIFEEQFPAFWSTFRLGLDAVATADQADPFPSSDRPGFSDIGLLVAENGADDDTESFELDEGFASDSRSQRLGDDDPDSTDDETEEESSDTRVGTAAAAGSPRIVDATSQPGAMRFNPHALARLLDALSNRPGRRWLPSPTGPRIDPRRSLRHSVSTAGIALPLETMDRRSDGFRACLLVDVSESVLDAIDRAFLLDFLDAIVETGRDVRVFFFDTDIRDVTDAFADRSADPIDILSEAEVAWGGGTRIGHAIEGLRRQWPMAVDRRTTTIVISDGLESGEVDTLEREMAWLARHSRSVIWFNPLAVSSRYAPACRGMAASLPFLDGLFAFGGSADIAEAARQIERHGVRGPIGFSHDFRDRGNGPRVEVMDA